NGQAQRGVVLAQAVIDRAGQPARMAELERIAMLRMSLERFEELLKTLKVLVPASRKLEEHRTELLAEPAGVVQQPLERLFGVFQFLHVCEVATGLNGEQKPRRRLALP